MLTMTTQVRIENENKSEENTIKQKSFDNKYPSITGSYKMKDITRINSMDCGEFVVSEKIHGANFGVSCERSEDNILQIFPFRRNGYLEKDEKFHNYQKIVAVHEKNFHKVFLHMETLHGTKKVVIYFEIYGGYYPHKDVLQEIKIKAVQLGVFYSPNIHIRAFDVKLDGTFINIDEMNHILNKFDIPKVDILQRGTLEECLKYDNKFNSTLHKIHDLPPLENNICEGIVIKPVISKFKRNGSRVIFKNKNDHFKEIHIQKNSNKKQKSKKGITLLDVENKVLEEIDSAEKTYITLQRLDNVRGNMKTLESHKDLPILIQNMFDDIMKDFSKDMPNIFDDLTKVQKNKINRELKRRIVNMIKPLFEGFL